MTQAQINRLIRPYLVRQQREQRKREVFKWCLSGFAALWVAILLWFLFLLFFQP